MTVVNKNVVEDIKMSSFNKASGYDVPSQENLIKNRVEEIEKLEKIVDESLVEIESLQAELRDLEKDLNIFLDKCYGANAGLFKSADESKLEADNDNTLELKQAKQSIYEKIAKVCSQDSFNLNSEKTKEGLLKIEGYLAEGKDQPPQDVLSSLMFECYNLMQQIRTLKEKKQSLLGSPAYELKQEVMWANIKASEAISRIKEELTHHVNKLN